MNRRAFLRVNRPDGTKIEGQALYDLRCTDAGPVLRTSFNLIPDSGTDIAAFRQRLCDFAVGMSFDLQEKAGVLWGWHGQVETPGRSPILLTVEQ